ncbi:MAG: hypothetical protein IPL10_02360 [Bacteroidetes bacterium]|nr:hypothetical protein [Bacteroidota bacterium]
MAKGNSELTIKDLSAKVLSSPEGIDMLQARELLYLELFLGKETVDANNVRVVLNGINKMGYFKPNEWAKYCGGDVLTFTEMKKITKKWLKANYILGKVKKGSGQLEQFEGRIESIPLFDSMLFCIFNDLPLNLNHKLPKLKVREERQLIYLVFKVVKGSYLLTAPKKSKRTFTINQFCVLVGFIIKKFLYNFPKIKLNDPKKLGAKVRSAIDNTDPRALIRF